MANTGLDGSGSVIYLRTAFGTGADDTNAYVFGSAVYFQRGTTQQLPILDSGTPANNRGLPVVLLSGDGADLFATGSGADGATVLRSTLSTRHESATTPLSVRLTSGTSFLAGRSSAATSLPIVLSNEDSLDQYITGQGSQTALNQNVLLASAGTGSIDCQQYRSIAIQVVVAAGTVTAGAITFEGSNDNTNWQAVVLWDAGNIITNPVTNYTLAANTPRYFVGPVFFRYFRARISTGITGTTTGVQAFTILRMAAFHPQNNLVAQATATSLNAQITLAASQTLGTLTNITNWGNLADNAAFTDGTTRVSMGGYILDETAGTALTENDAAAARIDSKRAQVLVLEDATTRGQRQAVSAIGAAAISSIGNIGTSTITRPANTNPYSNGDVIGGALTIATAGPTAGHIMITGIDLILNISAVPSGMANLTLYLYDVTPPSAIADNAAWDLPSGDRASCLTPNGIFLGTPIDKGSTCVIQLDNMAKQLKLAAASTSLFAYLVTDGFTPAANSETYTLRLYTMGV